MPKFPVSYLEINLQKLGFENITEMVHTKLYTLDNSLEIRSFQVSHQDDSVIVVSSPDTVFVNLNDAKPSKSTWKSIKNKYPKIDFLARSHSPAWSYPGCYTFEDKKDHISLGKEEYIGAYYNAVDILRPKWAIPFASGICHLHDENFAQNQHLVLPFEVGEYIRKNPIPGVEFIDMTVGSSWDEESGFQINNETKVLDKSVALERQKGKYLDELEKGAKKEAAIKGDFEKFKSFMTKFMSSIFLFRPLIRAVMVYKVERETEYWVVDVPKAEVYKTDIIPANFTSLIQVNPAVINEAISEFTYVNIDISKRCKVLLSSGAFKSEILFNTFMLLWEAGYINPKFIMTRRCLIQILRRRKEIVDYVILALGFIFVSPKFLAETITNPLETNQADPKINN